MFGTRRPAPQQHGTSPLMGGIAGAVLQNVINRKIVNRGGRGGGVKGLLLGMAATYVINRVLTGRRRGPTR